MKKFGIILVIILLHLIILSLTQFTAWPEMLSFPYLLNNDFITYKDMVHAYPPLLIDLLAVLFKVFGYEIFTLKIFTWTFFILNDVLIFLLIKKITNKINLSLVAVFIYVILQTVLEGNMIWPDLIIVPFLLLGTLLTINRNYWFAGVSFALALLVKQTGVFFIGIMVIYMIIFEKERKKIFFFGSGLVIPIFIFLIQLIEQKSLTDFLNWAIIYPSQYWTKFPGYVQLTPSLRDNLTLLLLFIPLVFLILKSRSKIFLDNKIIILLGFLIAGFIGLYPRFSFFHLQAFIAYFVVVIACLLKNFSRKYIYVMLFVSGLVLILNFKSLSFNKDRFWTDGVELGQKIKNETNDNKSIYLLGLNSDVYAFADRLPNKPWVDNFGWYLEIPGVQESVVASFKKEPPSKIFWRTPDAGNWYDIGSYQPRMITSYIEENYTRSHEIETGIWVWIKN